MPKDTNRCGATRNQPTGEKGPLGEDASVSQICVAQVGHKGDHDWQPCEP